MGFNSPVSDESENSHINITDQEGLAGILKKIESIDDFLAMKQEIGRLISGLEKTRKLVTGYAGDWPDDSGVFSDYILDTLEKARKSFTQERCRYYIHRLLKTMTTRRIGKINDLDMNRWKDYTDIITDSLWVMDKRDRSGAHNAAYWGNFIPQIPQQLLKRYTKKNDWVLDTFAGSGTTLIECQRAGRNAIGIDLSPEAIQSARDNLSSEISSNESKINLINADSTEISYRELLQKFGIGSVQLVIMHPPYWDIIKFSKDDRDLSNAGDLSSFLAGIRKIAEQSYSVLEKDRYLAMVIGDKYSRGEWIPLGFYAMSEVMKAGFRLKSTVVKNFDTTRGKKNQKELWRYRALLGGFYVFKHEYIFLFQK